MVGIAITGSYPNQIISSDYWLQNSDGTTTAIRPNQVNTNVFMHGSGSDSEANGTKLFYDKRTGFLFAGTNTTVTPVQESNRGTNSINIGADNLVSATNSAAIGASNTIRDCSNSSVYGTNNLIDGTDNSIIFGANNSMTAGLSTGNLISGTGNVIESPCNNTTLLGNGNTVSIGFPLTSTLIVGGSHDVAQSDRCSISGFNHIVNGCSHCEISGKNFASIFNCDGCSISGNAHSIGNSQYCNVSGSTHVLQNLDGSIVGGVTNTVTPSTSANRMNIFGHLHNITGVDHRDETYFGLGHTNAFSNTKYNMLLGRSCTVGADSTQDNIAIGNGHVLSNATSGKTNIYEGSNCNDGGFAGVHICTGGGSALTATANDQCLKKYDNGYIFYTNNAQTTGVRLPAGTSAWASVSDVNKKENLTPVDCQDCLDRVRKLPIFCFNYKDSGSEDYETKERLPPGPKHRCIYPTAQDWNAAFPSTKDPLLIDSMDVSGVLLSCVKELSDKVERLEKTILLLSEK